MKNLKKVLAVMTSVAALCTSMSAFAAATTTYGKTDGTTDSTPVFSFTYNSETNAITAITMNDVVADGNVTLLVTQPGVARQSVGKDDIWYIDQSTKADNFGISADKALGLLSMVEFTSDEKAAADTAGTAITKDAPVYLGYYTVATATAVSEFKIAAGKITATYTPEVQTTTITVKWGDITGDDVIDTSDSLAALMKYIGQPASYTVKEHNVTVGETLGSINVWGDITGDEVVDTSDSLAALMKYIGQPASYTVQGKQVTVGDDFEITMSDN